MQAVIETDGGRGGRVTVTLQISKVPSRRSLKGKPFGNLRIVTKSGGIYVVPWRNVYSVFIHG